MVILNIIFGIILVAFAYAVLKVFKFPDPMPKYLCLIFDGIVFVMWILQLFGVGK